MDVSNGGEGGVKSLQVYHALIKWKICLRPKMVGKKKQTILTGNDVLDFNRFYNGKEEPPIFRKQFIDLKDKIFVPISYIKFKNLIY